MFEVSIYFKKSLLIFSSFHNCYNKENTTAFLKGSLRRQEYEEFLF